MTEWEHFQPIIPVVLENGERTSDVVMRNTVDGRYRRMTDEEAKTWRSFSDW